MQTTLPFHRFVARSDAFRDADLSTGWVESTLGRRGGARRDAVAAALLAAGLAAIDAATRRPDAGAAGDGVDARPAGDGRRWRQAAGGATGRARGSTDGRG